MILEGLHTLDGERIERRLGPGDARIRMEDALIFPGLVNAHDHLEFNLFPRLGEGPYTDYTQWGHHIHARYAQVIAEVRRIPEDLRARWGLYKNLLCGITTVVHHGERISIPDAPIRIWLEAQTIHSVRFDRLWALRLNNPRHRHEACMIHIGEGTNESAAQEIDRLLRRNLLRRKLIGIHGIAMNPAQSAHFHALVWCPDSNFFLFNKTAPVDQLRTPLLFGTDSTLTASWDLWSQLRLARSTRLLTDRALYDTLHANAINALGLPRYSIRDTPDFVVARRKSDRNLDAFFAINPEDMLLVVAGEKIRLVDHRLSDLIRPLAGFTQVLVNGVAKWVEGDLPALMASIRQHHPGAAFPVALPDRTTAPITG